MMGRPGVENDKALRYECYQCKRVLDGCGIYSNNDFRRWAVHNHPDKGGALREFQNISRCVDLVIKQHCEDDPCRYFDYLFSHRCRVIPHVLGALSPFPLTLTRTLPLS